MTDRQRNSFILVLVVGLLLASLVVIAGIPGAVKPQKTRLGLDLKGGVELVYQAQPTAQTPKVTPDALARAVDIMRERTNQLGVSETQIQTNGGDQISAGLPNVTNTARAEKLVGSTARLEFYDWEANALAPNGRTVASQLQTQDQSAIGHQPGVERCAGQSGRRQHDALRRRHPGLEAAVLTEQGNNARNGAELLPVRLARERGLHGRREGQGHAPVAGQHCLLSGPDDNRHGSDLRPARRA